MKRNWVLSAFLTGSLLSVTMPATAQERPDRGESVHPRFGGNGGGEPRIRQQRNDTPRPAVEWQRPSQDQARDQARERPRPSMPRQPDFAGERVRSAPPVRSGDAQAPAIRPGDAAPNGRTWSRDDRMRGERQTWDGNRGREDARRTRSDDDWRRGDDRDRTRWSDRDRQNDGWRDNDRRNDGWRSGNSDWKRDQIRRHLRLSERDRWRDQRRWDNDWRHDRRYDWQRYRSYNREFYRMPRYYAPYGWNHGYQRFSIGIYLNNVLWSDRYWISDPYNYRLPPAYGSLRWVRYYDDALLIDIRDGYIVDVIHNFFW